MSDSFDSWGLVEIMGHDRIAGRITEATVGGTAFVRVDVPEVGGRQKFTKMFGPNAIFSISLTTEETARALAARLEQDPVALWDARRAIAAEDAAKALPPVDTDEDEFDTHW